jgi:DNA polymerase bacteriophage-type
MYDKLFLDFETYYDVQCSLRKLTIPEYINHPLFKVWGLGVRFEYEEDTTWLSELEVVDFINEVDWANTAVICHNTLFDAYILTQYYKIYPAYYYDTASMARGDQPTMSASLKNVSERLFPDDASMRKGEELINAKGVETLDPELDKVIGDYCIQDVDLTYAAFNKLVTNYPVEELGIIDLTTRMFVEPTLVVNKENLSNYLKKITKEAEDTIAACGIDRKVLSSNPQFAGYLESIGIVPPTKVSPTTGKNIPAFGKNDQGYKQLIRMYPEYQTLWDARLAVKSRISQTRAKRFLDATNPQGTISVPLTYYAAHTGRFGGTDKLNMQNMPRGSEIRKSLEAPEGMYVYVADLSNIEARMLAWIADENELLAQFAAGEDIYSNFASLIYDRPINKYDNPTERFVGKTAILGLGYGMGYKKFAATLRTGFSGPPTPITDDEALKIVNTYRKKYIGITRFWKLADTFLLSMLDKNAWGNTFKPLTIQEKSIRLPNGLSLKYNDLKVKLEQFEDYTQKIYSYSGRNKIEHIYGGRLTENIVQALARIVITDSILKISDYLHTINGKVVLTVHDEIVVVAPQENADEILDTLIKYMTVRPIWAANLPLAAEGGYDKGYSK